MLHIRSIGAGQPRLVSFVHIYTYIAAFSRLHNSDFITMFSFRGGVCLILLAFPLILILAFSSFPKSSTHDPEDNQGDAVRSQSDAQVAEKSADLPHVPQHIHQKDLSLSEKAAVAVAGLVGPGAPTSVFDFRAKTIGNDILQSRVVSTKHCSPHRWCGARPL